MTGMEIKLFVRSIAAKQVPEDVLLCSSNETISGMVHHLVNVRIIHYKSLRYICLLHRPNKAS